MKLTKQSESFNLTDKFGELDVTGTVRKSESIDINIANEMMLSASAYINNGNVSFNVNCPAEQCAAFVAYFNGLIETVLADDAIANS